MSVQSDQITEPKTPSKIQADFSRNYIHSVQSFRLSWLLFSFTIYPVIYAVRISFYRIVLTKPNSHPFIGLENFQDVITSYYFKTALINTAVYTIAAVIGVILFGLFVALAIKYENSIRKRVKNDHLLPWAIPAVVAGLMWKWILNSDFGILMVCFILWDHRILYSFSGRSSTGKIQPGYGACLERRTPGGNFHPGRASTDPK